MDFRNTTTKIFSLGHEQFDIRSYTILDKAPPELYREVLKWSQDELNFNKMTISISDSKSHKTLIVSNKPAVVVDGLGMCEIELRGVLQDIEIKNHKSITLNTSFLPVLHYSNGMYAMTMVLDREVDELEDLINGIVLPVLDGKFDEIYLSEVECDIDMTMTRFFTSEKDIKSFLNEDVINYITTPCTFDLK